MVNLYVLNPDFTVEGVIDTYVSVIWRPAYYDIGDFELYLDASKDAIALLKEDRYLVKDNDITVSNGVVTYKNVMIIKNVSLITQTEGGDFLTITGRELKFLLNKRIVWSQTNLTGRAEAGIRALVTQNAITPTETNRAIPDLILDVGAGLTDTIEKQVTGDKLDTTIIEICTNYKYGWDIYIHDNKLVFRVYKGLDRSYGQNERPYVVFSDDFDNLYNTEYQLETELYANAALIGGEGEGTERTFTTVNNDKSGLDRIEIFVDAKDISSNAETGEEIPHDQYIKLLQERGYENLAENNITEGFSGEVLSDVTFKYGTDFDLGDTVTVINKYGITKNVMVLSAIESIDESGYKLIPQFNI